MLFVWGRRGDEPPGWPVRSSGRTYAISGYVAVRYDGRVEWAHGPATEQTETRIEWIDRKIEAFKEKRPSVEVPTSTLREALEAVPTDPIYTRVECPECGGDGTVTCPECGETRQCKRCLGHGSVDDNTSPLQHEWNASLGPPALVRLLGSGFNPRYLKAVWEAGRLWNENAQVYPACLTPSWNGTPPLLASFPAGDVVVKPISFLQSAVWEEVVDVEGYASEDDVPISLPTDSA
jgi:acylphosphatase